MRKIAVVAAISIGALAVVMVLDDYGMSWPPLTPDAAARWLKSLRGRARRQGFVIRKRGEEVCVQDVWLSGCETFTMAEVEEVARWMDDQQGICYSMTDWALAESVRFAGGSGGSINGKPAFSALF